MTYAIIITISFLAVTAMLVRSICNAVNLEGVLQDNLKIYNQSGAALAHKIEELIKEKASLQRRLQYKGQEVSDTQERLDGKAALIAEQRTRMKHLRNSNKELKEELALSSDLSAVRFTAVLPNGYPSKTEFKLGLGPCGLVVKSLRWTEQEDRYVIEQLCTNGERKSFTYFKEDVKGRIEFRHGK